MPALPADYDEAEHGADLSPPLQAAALAAVTVVAALLILLVRSI